MNKLLVAAAALVVIALAGVLILGGAQEDGPGKTQVRIGYFPNMLHAQALVGRAQNSFQDALGPDAEAVMIPFNAGPSVIEAMFADELDIAYIGPNPAINGYIKSKGEALSIIAGAASGGAVLVVRNDSGIGSPADFAGKRVASPQLGNTQDVALRAYLAGNNLRIGTGDGEVEVIPTANPDILTLFQKKEIDGAWVPEPWGARLVQEGGGRVYLDERTLWPDGKFVTAHVIASRKFLREHPDLVEKILSAHVNLTIWINGHPQDAKAQMNAQIMDLTSKELPAAVLDEAFGRCEITYDPVSSSLEGSARSAYELGFLGDTEPDLAGIYNLTALNGILRERGLGAVR
ncbi:ABC transporter substrate-binding protein [Candidatus Micrarchaeota archaeon]|nr:ABC transporter substrate-binding protein [Candidatus Micrarchaeota archaeon]